MASFTDVFDNLTLNEDRFVGLITNMISVSEKLQNNPAQGIFHELKYFFGCIVVLILYML